MKKKKIIILFLVFAFIFTSNVQVTNHDVNAKEIKVKKVLQLPKKGRAAVAAIPAGAYVIVGIGRVIVTATGVIIIGGIVIKFGSYLRKKIVNYLSNKSNLRLSVSKAYGIPKALIKNNGNVDLGKFTKNVRGKNAKKDPKSGYVKEKDLSGHRNGSNKWKIKDKKGNRKATTDAKGKILGK